jgi:hypothetical protein
MLYFGTEDMLQFVSVQYTHSSDDVIVLRHE